MATDSESADRRAAKKPGTRHRVSLPASPRKLNAGKDVAKAKPASSALKEIMAKAKRPIDSSLKAALVISEFTEQDPVPLAIQLQVGMNAISNNDMRKCEAMMYCQMHSLQAIFPELTRQAVLEVKDGWAPHYETHMRLALKAQSQCRATAETLAQIKNSNVIFTKQANIAHLQQVNNEMMPAAEPSRGRGKNRKAAEQTIRGQQ